MDSVRSVGPRVLDRHRLGHRGRAGGRSVAPAGAHAVPRDRPLRVARDRPALRRHGRRAQRGNGQGDHVGLRPRARRPPPRGVRRHARDGLEAAHRGRRTSTTSVRSSSRRSRCTRTTRRTRSSTSSARRSSAGIRSAARSSAAPTSWRAAAPTCCAGLPRAALRPAQRRAGRGRLDRPRRARRARARGRRGAPCRPATAPLAPPPPDGAGGADAVHPQGHRAVPRVPRRAGHRPRRRAPLGAAGPRQRPRRHVVLAAVPGGARAARPGLQRLLVQRPARRARARSASTSARDPTTSARRMRVVGAELERFVADPVDRRGAGALEGEREGPHGPRRWSRRPRG